MTTRKKTNYIITVVLSAFILLLMAVGVSYGAKKPSPKPANKPKSGQFTKKKADQFLQRVEKNNPERAVRLRKLRKNNPDKFRKTVRKALKTGAAKPGADTEKTANPKGSRGKQHRLDRMGWRQRGHHRGGRFTRMGWHRDARGRGGRFAQMDRPGGGRGKGRQFAQMDRPGGGRGRGGRFAQMGRPGGGRGRGGRFGRAKHPRPEGSDIWGDDDWYW